MKYTIGMKVSGECGVGPIVAMTKEWCIYMSGKHEVAEPWDCIMAELDKPDTVEGSLKEFSA